MVGDVATQMTVLNTMKPNSELSDAVKAASALVNNFGSAFPFPASFQQAKGRSKLCDKVPQVLVEDPAGEYEHRITELEKKFAQSQQKLTTTTTSTQTDILVAECSNLIEFTEPQNDGNKECSEPSEQTKNCSAVISEEHPEAPIFTLKETV